MSTCKKLLYFLLFLLLSSSRNLPSLSWQATTTLTFRGPVCTSVVALSTGSICYSRPISSYALSIDPHLTFPHASHVQCQRLISIWCVKICLHSSNIDDAYLSNSIKTLKLVKAVFWDEYSDPGFHLSDRFLTIYDSCKQDFLC